MSRVIRSAALVLTMALTSVSAVAQGLDLDLYDTLLEQHTKPVSDLARTRVDYRAIAKDPRWQRLLRSLEASKPDTFGSKAQKLAFWINAYNILAIDLVANNYPLESIKDIGSLFSPVWKRPAGRIGGSSYSLDEIEHGIIRPLGDPRAHAAVVCASTSCPELRREAWRAEALDAQLDDAMRTWIADPGKGLKLDRQRKIITLSKIFYWFEEDFAPAGGAVAFATRFANDADRSWLVQHGSAASVRYFDYDWRVNAIE